MRINVTRSVLPPLEEYMQEIAPLWDSRWLTNMGEKHKTLERMLQGYFDAPNVTLFTNGHLALEGLLAAFGLTGEVVTTPSPSPPPPTPSPAAAASPCSATWTRRPTPWTRPKSRP